MEPSTAADNRQIELSRWRNGISVLLLGCIALFLYDVQVTEETTAVNVNGLVRYKKQLEGLDVELKQAATNTGSDATIHVVGQQQLPGDASAPEIIRNKRDQFFEQLKTDYGEDNFAGIFFQPQEEDEERIKVGRSLFTSTHGKSWKRLERKFKIKLLEAKLLHQKGETSRLVWASGGHSSAAGHGNFLDEAYTAVMERTMKPIFATVGIDFEARPYAMGGTSSGEELALCIDQIFGEDIDILTWDFGMMEGKQEWKQLLYTYHAALGKNHPVAIGLDIGSSKKRIQIYSELEELGMTVFYKNDTVNNQMKDAIPETQGLTEKDIAQMPPFVKQLKCNSGLEVGDPGCASEKFNRTYCEKRKSRVKWHPGWKVHALSGNSLSLFLIEVLIDAVEALEGVSDREDLHALLKQYKEEEEEAYNKVLASEMPEELDAIASKMPGSEEKEIFENFNLRDLYKRQTYCHTALLPAQIRYKGLLTGDFDNSSPSSYAKGIPQPIQRAAMRGGEGKHMRLAHDPRERQDCPYNVGIDFKDFYYLSSEEGSKRVIIPNKDTQKYYNVDTSSMLGIVIMCLTACDWGKCRNGDLRSEFDQGPLKMSVNGVPVTEFNKIGICWALKGEENEYKWKPNAQGKFEIEASLAGKNTYLRFSSFILV